MDSANAPQKRLNLLEIGIEFGLIIGIPLVLFIGAGLWADKQLGTVPLFILVGLFAALALSTVMLYKKIKAITQ